MYTRATLSLFTLLTLAALGGCSSHGGFAELGVTQGGAQDIRLAREIIAGGGIPSESYFTAEGLFSEHDLPLDGEECAEVLCPRAATALIDPVDLSGEQLLVQLGFATSIDLAVSVDVSGSMADGKLDSVKQALKVMVSELGEDDQVALIAFDDRAWIELGMRRMDQDGRQALRDAIDELRDMGSTNIEAGLELAYGQVAPDAAMAGYEDRVMLFTDAQPNVAATDVNSFLGMARYYSAAGIGISVFGVGLDLGSELATAVSETRGGNYFFLADQEAIAQVFDEEFAYMVSPVAYDLNVKLTPTAGLEMVETYAAPLDQQAGVVDFGASTLFLSKRAGGMGVTLTGQADLLELEGSELARLELRYETADDSELVELDMTVGWNGGATIEDELTLADDLGVYKMSRLVDEYQALLAGADFCSGELDRTKATAAIEEAADRLHAIGRHLHDDALMEEAGLMDLLAANVGSGSGACYDDPYGYY